MTTVISGRKVALVLRDVDATSATFDDVNLSNSRFDNVNMIGVKITDANLTSASIADAQLDGFTINGVLVSELFACWHANHGADNA